jgi:hypothetical protein
MRAHAVREQKPRVTVLTQGHPRRAASRLELNSRGPTAGSRARHVARMVRCFVLRRLWRFGAALEIVVQHVSASDFSEKHGPSSFRADHRECFCQCDIWRLRLVKRSVRLHVGPRFCQGLGFCSRRRCMERADGPLTVAESNPPRRQTASSVRSDARTSDG